MKRNDYATKRFKKLKNEKCSWYIHFENKLNKLFKSNGINCTCHRCRSYSKMKKDGKHKTPNMLKVNVSFKQQIESLDWE